MNNKELATKIVTEIVLKAYHWDKQEHNGETYNYGVVEKEAISIVEQILDEHYLSRPEKMPFTFDSFLRKELIGSEVEKWIGLTDLDTKYKVDQTDDDENRKACNKIFNSYISKWNRANLIARAKHNLTVTNGFWTQEGVDNYVAIARSDDVQMRDEQ